MTMVNLSIEIEISYILFTLSDHFVTFPILAFPDCVHLVCQLIPV